MSVIDRFTNSWAKFRKPGYYDEFDYAWTMSVDRERCSGCGACVTACQAENNLPVVGEDEMARGREMTWIRVERYWDGDYPDVKLHFIPMMCQHCDTAPCETVCPVSATYHNQDGLNTQVYNRCIGTRSCAVYCPYEVRYFNYYDHHWDSPLDQQLNPDVTVREKGVMEKCTFCIQRIRQAKDHAKDDGRRRVQDGEVQPACAQTCPTEALVFGNRLDPDSEISKSLENPRAYRVLDELNTNSSVIYLKKVDADAS